MREFDAVCNHDVEQHDWMQGHGHSARWSDRERQFRKSLAERWIYPLGQTTNVAISEPLEERLSRLAEEWAHRTGHISSASDIINDARYQEIISVGWPAVPFLLNDLACNKRFWFPALAAITGLRPFDGKDAGNYRLMTDAWIRWGKRKGLI